MRIMTALAGLAALVVEAARRRPRAVLVALALAGAAQPASAAVVTTTATGVIPGRFIGVADSAGELVFGGVSEAFTLVTRFDTRRGQRLDSAGVKQVIGGTDLLGSPASPGTGTLSIAGRSFDFDTTNFSLYRVRADGSFAQFVREPTVQDQTRAVLLGFGAPFALDRSFSTDNAELILFLRSQDRSFAVLMPSVLEPGPATISGVSVTVTAIPEPGQWALMIAGFGLVGAGLRARRIGFSHGRRACSQV